MTSTTRPAGTQQQAPAHRWWPLLVIASAHLMAILDTTIMFVARPSAQRAFSTRPRRTHRHTVARSTLGRAARAPACEGVRLQHRVLRPALVTVAMSPAAAPEG